jgi:hypothetical protein
MAVLYGANDYGCGKYEATGWDAGCPETSVWDCAPPPLAGTDHTHGMVTPIKAVTVGGVFVTVGGVIVTSN